MRIVPVAEGQRGVESELFKRAQNSLRARRPHFVVRLLLSLVLTS